MQQVSALLNLLEAEAQAIKQADFEALPALQRQLETLMPVALARSVSRADLRLIKRQLASNQSLLQASIRGMQAAQARMSELVQVQQGLSVYDNAGTRTTVPAPFKNIEKKA